MNAESIANLLEKAMFGVASTSIMEEVGTTLEIGLRTGGWLLSDSEFGLVLEAFNFLLLRVFLPV